MDKLINKWAVKSGLIGSVAACAMVAGSILIVSGQNRSDRQPRHGTNPALAKAVVNVGDAPAGRRKYMQTCAACHGTEGQGQPHQGANLKGSQFIRQTSDDQLVDFIKSGRQLGDPKSVLGLSMPPMGGNPTLEERQVRDIVAFLRTLQQADETTASSADAR